VVVVIEKTLISSTFSFSEILTRERSRLLVNFAPSERAITEAYRNIKRNAPTILQIFN
jgi:hypothetical protein